MARWSYGISELILFFWICFAALSLRLNQSRTEKDQLELLLKEKEQQIELLEMTRDQTQSKFAQLEADAKVEAATLRGQLEEATEKVKGLTRYEVFLLEPFWNSF